jgi:hydrogenase maturation factor
MTRILLAVALFCASVTGALAKCFEDRQAAIDALGSQRGVSLVTAGITVPGTLMMLLANEKTGEWVIVDVKPTGMACEVVQGIGWEQTPFEPYAQRVPL